MNSKEKDQKFDELCKEDGFLEFLFDALDIREVNKAEKINYRELAIIVHGDVESSILNWKEAQRIEILFDVFCEDPSFVYHLNENAEIVYKEIIKDGSTYKKIAEFGFGDIKKAVKSWQELKMDEIS